MLISSPVIKVQRSPEAVEQALLFDMVFAGFQPLVPVKEAAFLLSASPHFVFNSLEEGALRAVDIAAEGKDAGRRELRVYLYTIAHMLVRPQLPLQMIAPETILPHNRVSFMRQEVAKLLCCTEKHVGNIREFAAAQMSSRLPNIHRLAIVDFLVSREVLP